MKDFDEFIVDLSENEKALLGTTKEEQQKQAEEIIKHQLKKARKKFNQSLLGTEKAT